MATTQTIKLPGTTTVQLIGGSNFVSLTNASLLLSASFNNLASGAAALAGGYQAYITISYKTNTGATAGNSWQLWILGAEDLGTDGLYEDGGTSYTPDRNPDIVFPVAPSLINNTNSICQLPVMLKPGFQQFLLKNNTGVTMSGENNNTKYGLFLSAEVGLST